MSGDRFISLLNLELLKSVFNHNSNLEYLETIDKQPVIWLCNFVSACVSQK